MAKVETINISPIKWTPETLLMINIIGPQIKEVQVSGLRKYSQLIVNQFEEVLGKHYPARFHSGRWPRIDPNLGQVWLGFNVKKDPSQPENPETFINSSTISWVTDEKSWSVEAIHEGRDRIGPLRRIIVTSNNTSTSLIPDEAV